MVKGNKERGARGKAFERAIDKYIERLRELGVYAEQYHPETIGDGVRVAKHCFDFGVYYENVYYGFDAKMSAGTSLAIANLKDHQINAMKQVKNHGGDGFFLIYFYEEDPPCIIKLDVDEAISIIKSGRRSINKNDGVPSKVNFLEL